MRPRASLRLFALLAVFGLFGLFGTGCYQVDQPTRWACSAAEPLCPGGLVCNGQRCVASSDAAARDLAIDVGQTDVAADGPTAQPDGKPDGPGTPDAPRVPCSALADWTCFPNTLWVHLRCANREVFCDEDQVGWYCDCSVDGKVINDCGSVPTPTDLCATASNSFIQGCCRP